MSPVEIVRRIFEAVSRGDAAAVLTLYDDDVVFDMSHFQATGVMGRPISHGHEGLRQWFREWHEVWESFEEECEQIIPVGDHEVVSVRRWTRPWPRRPKTDAGGRPRSRRGRPPRGPGRSL